MNRWLTDVINIAVNVNKSIIDFPVSFPQKCMHKCVTLLSYATCTSDNKVFSPEVKNLRMSSK